MVPCCCPIARWVVRGLVIAAAFALACLSANPVRSQDAGTATALAKVPADAAGFLHIKVHDIWNADMTAGFRDMLAKAGPDAIAAFNKRFTPSPGSLDSIAVYLTAPDDDGPPIPCLIASFNEVFDPAKVLKEALPQGVGKNHFGQRYLEDANWGVAIRALDNKTLQLTAGSLMPRLITHEAKETGIMSRHIAAAAGKTIYGTFDLTALPVSSIDQAPEALRTIAKAKEIVLTGEAGTELALKLTVRYADTGAADAAEKAARAGVQMFRGQLALLIQDVEKRVTKPEDKSAGLRALPDAAGDLMNLASLKMVDEMLADVPLVKKGDSLVFEHRFNPNDPKTMARTSTALVGALLPAVQATRSAAARLKGQNNLRQIALALHNYHNDHGRLPPQAIYTKDGKKKLLSWRVAILPYIEHAALYKQFKLDEPWDSDNNKKLVERMPALFADPDSTAKEPGQTHYKVFFGGGSGFRTDSLSVQFADITDGTSNTIMIATAADAVPWSKPDDMMYDPSKPLPKLGLGGKPANVAFFDGSVRALPARISERNLRAYITAIGGELISDDE